ncbi:uracil-DNA glycosylase [Candidatus Woesearchaeota archaeon]|nr:uracil-DNA glycosylase [Candidatus Woesearchaeota archaeon]
MECSVEERERKLEEVKKRIIIAKLPLHESATNLVFGKGNSCANIMIIGEAAGANEDLQGLPFVGAAGKQLDNFLHMINLCIDDVYIANILKYRPPDNRNPNDEEIRTHTPFLIEQIKIIKPKIILTLGNFSTKFVLGGFSVEGMKKIEGITSLHGKPVEKELDGTKFLVIPMYHPAATLYKRSLTQELEKDFLMVKQILEK